MTKLPQPKSLGSGCMATYDAWNRWVKLDDATDMQTNECDALNRRIVRDETDNSSEVRHFYYHSEWQVFEERVGRATTANRKYVYHPYYVDAIVVHYDAHSFGDYYYLQDANFSVVPITQQNGDVVERYNYTTYGEACSPGR